MNKVQGCKLIRRFSTETFRITTVTDAKTLAIIRKNVWAETYRGIYSDDMIDNFSYSLHEQKFTIQIENPDINVYIILIGDEALVISALANRCTRI